MGKAARSTILQLDLSPRACGGANTEKRAALQQTSAILTEARAFFLDFLLTHTEKLTETMVYYSEKHQELRERLLSAEELRSWLEQCTVSTKAHPQVPAAWDFKARGWRHACAGATSGDERSHWQGPRLSDGAHYLAEERQEEGTARSAWSG